VKPYYEHGGIVIYHGDCREVLPTLTEKVDLVLTDPPYGRGAGTADRRPGHERARTKFVDRYDWDNQVPVDMLTWVARQDTYIVWGGNYFADILGSCNSPLMWHKCQEWNGAEFELAWTKNTYGNADTFWLPKVKAYTQEKKVHPTQKPTDLILWCLGKSKANGLVLDPFMGSGTTLVAAKQLGRKAIGIEIEERYCEIAAKRLAQEVLPLTTQKEDERYVTKEICTV